MREEFYLFWGGFCSQWVPSKFVIDGIEYNDCEQYMMSRKALLFKDVKTNQKIMMLTDPRMQKAAGREVKNFKADKWNAICRDVVYQANYAKFTQNPDLLKELISTGDKQIVEASPEDKIWGIGLHASDPRASDRRFWLGSNWLGEAITKVRETIKNDNKL